MQSTINLDTFTAIRSKYQISDTRFMQDLNLKSVFTFSFSFVKWHRCWLFPLVDSTLSVLARASWTKIKHWFFLGIDKYLEVYLISRLKIKSYSFWQKLYNKSFCLIIIWEFLNKKSNLLNNSLQFQQNILSGDWFHIWRAWRRKRMLWWLRNS